MVIFKNSQPGLNSGLRRCLRLLAVAAAVSMIFVSAAPAQPSAPTLPFINVQVDKTADTGEMSVLIQIFLLLTLISLAPSILIMVTSFTRIAIVLSIVRQALGTQQTPPNQVIIGLALFLTLFIMTPVWNTINEQAVKPFMNEEIGRKEAFEKGIVPIRRFMLKQTREKDLALFVGIAEIDRPANESEIPTSVLIPSFIISELKTAFQIAFLLYVPFLIVDMIVASILLSMGMMMLPPIMISLPFKIMLFVLADGWRLIVGSLVKGFM